MALPALAIPAAAARVVAAVLKHGQARAIERFGTDAVRAAVTHIRRLQVSREDPDRPGTTTGQPPPTRTRNAKKSDDNPYMRKGGKIKENAKMMDPMKMKMKNARKNMPQPKMAMGGMYGKKPQMMKGGQYKGKMHSYVGGGMVRDLETLRRK